MKTIALAMALLAITGCGSDGPGKPGKDAQAATACADYAKNQLGDKTYTLDQAVLAASMKDEGNGSMSLRGPIVIEPGRPTESKQTLECSVRFVAGKELPDVLKLQFIW